MQWLISSPGLRRARLWRYHTKGMWNTPSWTSSAGCAPPAPMWELPNSRNWARGQRLSGSPSSTTRSSPSLGLGAWREGWGSRARRAALCFLLHVVLVANFPLSLSEWQCYSHWLWLGFGRGRSCILTQCHQNSIASYFIVVPILFFNNFFTCFFPPSDK